MSFDDEVRFAIKMLELTGNVNVLFSPVSVLTGVSAIYYDAVSEAENELDQLFGKDQTKNEIIEYFSQTIKQCENKNGINIKFINHFFISATTKLSPEFIETVEEKLNGNIYQSDFDNKNMLTNVFFEKEFLIKTGTNNISLDENGFDPCRNSILINAVTFSSAWESIFDKAHMQIFNSDSPREIKFMSKTISADFGWNLIENEKWISLGIPYKNFEAWMFIVLPKENYSLSEMIKNLSIENFKEWTKRTSFPQTVVDVTIPLFTVSSTLKFKEILKKLGLNNVFTDVREKENGAEKSIKFDNLIHTSFITIDEYGTDVNRNTKLHRNYSPPSANHFTADRPFLYFVMGDNENTDKPDTAPSNLLYVGTFY